MHNRVQVLSFLPKLIQLLLARIAKASGDSDLNFQNFRLGVTLQDLAQLKIQIRKPEDALFHLHESERLLRTVKADGDQVSELLIRVSIGRNLELFKEAKTHKQLKLQEANKPKPDQAQEEKRERFFNVLVAAGAFIFGFTALKLILDRKN